MLLIAWTAVWRASWPIGGALVHISSGFVYERVFVPEFFPEFLSLRILSSLTLILGIYGESCKEQVVPFSIRLRLNLESASALASPSVA